MRSRSRKSWLLTAVVSVAATAAMLPWSTASAQSEPVDDDAFLTEDFMVPMSDGVEILVRLGGRGPLVDGHLPARPVIAEFTPYGPGCCPEMAGPDFNYLQVHIRGTGSSRGSFDALGPRSQLDVVEVLDWACAQPWHNGKAGLYGFSASAIMVYNSLHTELPCVESAVLGAGTHELYRDLMYPGGIPNGLPAIGVFAMIGAPAASSIPDRLAADPLSIIDFAAGMGTLAVDYLTHPTLDWWWRERGMRGNVNDFPVLQINGFFDVESRGPFQAFPELEPHGAHLYVVGAHDGIPAGSPGADVPRARWFERYLLGVENGIDEEPVVQLWMANGDRVDMLNGDFVTASGDTWPLPGTEWQTLHLDPARSGSASTLNDGTLSLDPPRETLSLHLPIQSLPTATDPYTTSLLGVFNDADPLVTMDLAEVLGQSYTTAPLADDVTLVGPAAAELVVTNTLPDADLYAVISDVWPDGSVHPMAAGRLKTAYPDIVEDKSLIVDGEVVRPYNDLSSKQLTILDEHRFHVEFWPIGNQFKAGHRIRLHLVGASMFHLPSLPGPQLVRLGGDDGGSLLRLPVAPGDDLAAALGGGGTVGVDQVPGGDDPTSSDDPTSLDDPTQLDTTDDGVTTDGVTTDGAAVDGGVEVADSAATVDDDDTDGVSTGEVDRATVAAASGDANRLPRTGGDPWLLGGVVAAAVALMTRSRVRVRGRQVD